MTDNKKLPPGLLELYESERDQDLSEKEIAAIETAEVGAPAALYRVVVQSDGSDGYERADTTYIQKRWPQLLLLAAAVFSAGFALYFFVREPIRTEVISVQIAATWDRGAAGFSKRTSPKRICLPADIHGRLEHRARLKGYRIAWSSRSFPLKFRLSTSDSLELDVSIVNAEVVDGRCNPQIKVTGRATKEQLIEVAHTLLVANHEKITSYDLGQWQQATPTLRCVKRSLETAVQRAGMTLNSSPSSMAPNVLSVYVSDLSLRDDWQSLQGTCTAQPAPDSGRSSSLAGSDIKHPIVLCDLPLVLYMARLAVGIAASIVPDELRSTRIAETVIRDGMIRFGAIDAAGHRETCERWSPTVARAFEALMEFVLLHERSHLEMDIPRTTQKPDSLRCATEETRRAAAAEEIAADTKAFISLLENIRERKEEPSLDGLAVWMALTIVEGRSFDGLGLAAGRSGAIAELWSNSMVDSTELPADFLSEFRELAARTREGMAFIRNLQCPCKDVGAVASQDRRRDSLQTWLQDHGYEVIARTETNEVATVKFLGAQPKGLEHGFSVLIGFYECLRAPSIPVPYARARLEAGEVAFISGVVVQFPGAPGYGLVPHPQDRDHRDKFLELLLSWPD